MIHIDFWKSAFEPVAVSCIFSLVDGCYDKGLTLSRVFKSVISGSAVGLAIHIYFFFIDEMNSKYEMVILCAAGFSSQRIIKKVRSLDCEKILTFIIKK